MSAQSDLISQQSDQLYQSINSLDYASAVTCHGFGCLDMMVDLQDDWNEALSHAYSQELKDAQIYN